MNSSELKASASSTLLSGDSKEKQEENENVVVEKNVEMRKFIEVYGEMISDSLKINNNSLIDCLDDIIRTLNSYFMLLDKSDVETKTYFEHVKPIIEAKQTELQAVYGTLDKLEVVVNRLKGEYLELDSRLNRAEKEVNSRLELTSSSSFSSSSSSTLNSQTLGKFRKFIDSKLSPSSSSASFSTITTTTTPTANDSQAATGASSSSAASVE